MQLTAQDLSSSLPVEKRAPSPAERRERKTRADLGWDTLIEHLAGRTHTTRGSAAARALEPSLDSGWIRVRLAEVSEARSLHDRGEPMPFGAIHDVEPYLARAEKGGHLEGSALREIAFTLDAGRLLRRHLAARSGVASTGGHAPRLAGRASLISELADVAAAIGDAFDDLGHLLDGASPALGPLRRKAAGLRDDLDRRSHALLDHPLIAPHLQDRFYTRRDDRFVLPIRTDARTRVKGIVHGTSGSGQTVFVEPEEIVDLNNRLKLAELEVADEERRILGELTLLVADAVRPIRINLEILSELDLIDAGARLSSDLRGQEPLLLDGENDAEVKLDLRRARHPLMVLGGRECVPNDIVLRRGGALVISGPNAGGKTVALKTAGLLSLMARAGLHLPVQEGSSLPLFSRLFTDVGDDQSLERNLSTFSAHVANLNEFLTEARPGVLILLDEIAVGTDPDQGAALAEAVLESLSARGATVIVTTHYERLKALAARDLRFTNASVGFDLARLAPTYELHLGVPGASGAIMVARRLGLPIPIADRAEQLLDGGSQEIEALLHQIEGERKRLLDATRAAEAQLAAATLDRERAEALSLEARERLKAARKAEHDDAVESLKRARLELDRVRSDLKKIGAPSKETVDGAERAIDRAASDLKKHTPETDAPAGRSPAPGELDTGVIVLVPRLGGLGTVSATPKGGKVSVQVGSLKLTVDESELLIPERRAGSPQKTKPKEEIRGYRKAFPSAIATSDPGDTGPAEKIPAVIRTAGNTLDLRGERVDAAIALAEKFLDDAMRTSQESVFFIHGHGTGALRSALRDHLATFPGVTSQRPGQPNEGGDGVTVVALG